MVSLWTIVCIVTAVFHGTVADSGADDATKSVRADEQMKDKVVPVETLNFALLQAEFKALKESFAEMKESLAKEMKALKDRADSDKESSAKEMKAMQEIIATKSAFIEHRLQQLESRSIQASVATPGTVAPPEGRRLSAGMGGSTAGISFKPVNGFSSGVTAPAIYTDALGELTIQSSSLKLVSDGISVSLKQMWFELLRSAVRNPATGISCGGDCTVGDYIYFNSQLACTNFQEPCSKVGVLASCEQMRGGNGYPRHMESLTEQECESLAYTGSWGSYQGASPPAGYGGQVHGCTTGCMSCDSWQFTPKYNYGGETGPSGIQDRNWVAVCKVQVAAWMEGAFRLSGLPSAAQP